MPARRVEPCGLRAPALIGFKASGAAHGSPRGWIGRRPAGRRDGGRARRAGLAARVDGPAVVAIRDGGVFDVSRAFPTMRDLCEAGDPAAALRAAAGERVGALADILANTPPDGRDRAKPWLLAPIDLQAIKAAGVTFVDLDARAGDRGAGARQPRCRRPRSAGRSTASSATTSRSSSPARRRRRALKEVLIEQGVWTQYLEVGIGPDAEIFTKAQPMAAVGTGMDAGLHPNSSWNNPEPEVVLVVSSAGRDRRRDARQRRQPARCRGPLGAAARRRRRTTTPPAPSARSSASSTPPSRSTTCATPTVTLVVEGPDGFRLEGSSSIAKISRDPADLVAPDDRAESPLSGRRRAVPRHHVRADRGPRRAGPGLHPQDRRHRHRSRRRSSGASSTACAIRGDCEPWTFGAGALMRNLAARRLI